jgi:hypothetical protein
MKYRFCLIVLMIVTLLTGCSKKLSQEDVQAVIQKQMYEIFVSVEEFESPEIAALKRRSSVTVNSVRYEDDTIIAGCDFQSLNLYKALTSLAQDAKDSQVTYEEYQEKIKNAVNAAENMREMHDVRLHKVDGQWTADFTYDDYNAYLGGYLDYMKEITALMTEEAP